MSKFCIAPFPVFWQKLDASGGTQEMLALYKEPVDTTEARQRIYEDMVAGLRERGELCEHPEHQPTEFKTH